MFASGSLRLSGRSVGRMIWTSPRGEWQLPPPTTITTTTTTTTASSSSSYSRRLLSSPRGNSKNFRQEFSRVNNNYSNYQNRYERKARSDIPRYVLWGGIGLPLAGVTYLYVHFLDRVPLTQRQRWIATSPEFERQLGDREYQQLLRQFRGQILPPDHRASMTVQRVGQRIYQAAQTFCKDHDLKNQRTERKSTVTSPPTFTVVRSDMANAFVLPNNHIFVMTGLFQYARNEEELASVLGHEMAHSIARHVGEKISGNSVVQVLARLSLLIDPSGTFMLLFLPTANLLRELPHSRTQELEADHIGMHLAAQACYDPAAAKRVFERMKREDTRKSGSGGAQPPEFLSTHPSHDSRLAKMDDWLPEARRILERDGGETCRHLRQDIERARQIAAQRAAEREWALRQRIKSQQGGDPLA